MKSLSELTRNRVEIALTKAKFERINLWWNEFADWSPYDSKFGLVIINPPLSNVLVVMLTYRIEFIIYLSLQRSPLLLDATYRARILAITKLVLSPHGTAMVLVKGDEISIVKKTAGEIGLQV